jgi:uncharacterized Zn-binding protein involved in type VI secretion
VGRAFITLGDRTSHGGTVITADYTFDIHGKYVARVGDMTVCPRCKGRFPITSGAPDMHALGQSVAREGDRTACGATLISRQFLATWSAESSAAPAAQAGTSETAASRMPAPESAKGVCLECLAKAAALGHALVPRA